MTLKLNMNCKLQLSRLSYKLKGFYLQCFENLSTEDKGEPRESRKFDKNPRKLK